MKATAKASANIAFIKYWGKEDSTLRLPLNTSISMNLSASYTVTTVDFSSVYSKDTVTLLGGTFSQLEERRVIESVQRIRERTHIQEYARVVTKNTFPKGTGSASSASGFAALTVAGFKAAGLALSEKELTIFARMGSGSACRSIPDGFVIWEKGTSSQDSYAYSLYDHTYWDLCDALVIVNSTMKKISTTEGMEAVKTSPFLQKRVEALPERINQIKQALQTKNFSLLGKIIEEDCLDMHHVMQTQTPPLMYWNDITKKIMDAVILWRKTGLAVYFTIDAGPNVHVIFEKKDQDKVFSLLKEIKEIETVIMNTVAPGTTIIKEDLF